MKRHAIFFAFAAICSLAGCNRQPVEQQVMARFVPERSDDFVFENNLIAGRFYGYALEGNPTSPGIDIWVKMPGGLVADKWYAEALKDPDYYHHNHDGKDCYKVAVSLGGGASAPIVDRQLALPPTNYRAWEILEQAPDKVVFSLHYPEWEVQEGVTVSLDKKVTVTPDTYFCRVDDTYTFTGQDELTIAAGVLRHGEQKTIERESVGEDRYAIWEHASDQSIEPENGMLGVAVYMPGAEQVVVAKSLDHGLVLKTVKSGEPLTYYFGSCWSKGDIKTSKEWFNLVNELQ